MKKNKLTLFRGMVKRVLPLCLFAFLPLSAAAQSDSTALFHFGWLSYDSVLTAMPEYATVQAELATLRAQYEAEQQRVEDEFNKKYEAFLDGQRDFPATILQKRQSELQEMLDRNIAFKQESLRLLAAAEAEAMAPLRQKLATALYVVGTERGLAFILNTDSGAAPFVNPFLGEDVTDAVREALGD